MQFDLVLFYNFSGAVVCVFSLFMFALRKQEGEEGIGFNIAKNYLGVMFMLTGLSMFVAQFDRGIDQGHFEILNPLMLLFFFLISQGMLWSFLVLYASRYANRQMLNRVLLPVCVLFGIYTCSYFFVGDEPAYSAREFLVRLPGEPLLMLRCIILAATAWSVLYNIRLCHLARQEYHNLISSYFSETDFSRSIWLSNLLASGEALSVWIFLTYFYTTPVLEVVTGIFIMAVFAFYIKEFYEYRKRHERFRPALLLSGQEDILTETVEIQDRGDARTEKDDLKCAALLADWRNRADKPFTKAGLTINDVSKDLQIPKYRISYCVNREQGNFCSWINGLRTEEATRLLVSQPSLSISDVAERTGFCDLPAFSRAFKKVYHVSPREYRNNAPAI